MQPRRFCTDVLGGKTVISGEGNDEVTYIALANNWIIINVGGGRTDDKPIEVGQTTLARGWRRPS
jgi:hypothetical protein